MSIPNSEYQVDHSFRSLTDWLGDLATQPALTPNRHYSWGPDLLSRHESVDFRCERLVFRLHLIFGKESSQCVP
jgi:hypothetical protein